eukprot:15396961-Alexandrium_andersonii.AAC.1
MPAEPDELLLVDACGGLAERQQWFPAALGGVGRCRNGERTKERSLHRLGGVFHIERRLCH